MRTLLSVLGSKERTRHLWLVICEFQDIQVCLTREKTTDLFSHILKYEKMY